MKSIYTKMLMAISLMAVSCSPEEFNDIGQPVKVIEGTKGTWKVTQVIQTDEDAANKGFPYRQLDVTNFFKDSEITLSLDASGMPSDFSTKAGSALSVIPIASGKWYVDDTTNPTVATFVNNTDTVLLNFGNTNLLPANQLQMKVNRRVGAKLFSSYSYNFTKVQ